MTVVVVQESPSSGSPCSGPRLSECAGWSVEIACL
jgi:hypothetical protein